MAGRTAYPLRRFTPTTVVAALLWAAFATMLGYIGGSAFHEQTLLATGLGIVLAIGFGALIELAMSWRRRSLSTAEVVDDDRGGLAA
jgi:membrane protein DedA with SNARE-associated domain